MDDLLLINMEFHQYSSRTILSEGRDDLVARCSILNSTAKLARH